MRLRHQRLDVWRRTQAVVRRQLPACILSICLLVLLGGLGGCSGDMRGAADPAHLTMVRPTEIGRQAVGTGFFIDGNGHILTAAHVAENCTTLYINREGRMQRARVVARSTHRDLALLKVESLQGLPAVFSRSNRYAVNDMAFVAGYQVLQDILGSGGALFNATVVDGDDKNQSGDVILVSKATHGASGAPVLNSNGLVIGVVVRRLVNDRVVAVGAEDAKNFLLSEGVGLQQDDRPQIGPLQDRARRAGSISVGISCFKAR